MKNLILICLLVPSLTLLLSCNKDDDTGKNQCIFVQNDADMDGRIDDDERAIMDDCMANALTTENEMKATFIGEWELVGFGHGWTHTPSQPCGYITITEDELVLEFENAYIDTITTHTWAIEEVSGTNRLTITPSAEGLWINTICSNYMFGDATPVDGNMYLYQKVE